MIKNVKEFINYRTTCPVCSKNLSLAFKGKNRKIVRYEGNRVLIKKDMYTLNKQRSYSFIYAINMYDNTFYVDFTNSRNETLTNSVPISYVQGFNKYNKSNTGIFYRFCPCCSCYCYSSNYFSVDMKQSRLENFFIKSEYLATYRKINDSFRVYRINNLYDKGNSVVDWFTTEVGGINSRSKMEWDYTYFSNDSMLRLPIQNMDNTNELVDRLEKLLYFT